MQILVTGATGLVGNAIVNALVRQKFSVRALVRNPERAKAMLPQEVECVAGDITDPSSLDRHMVGIERCFHAAGMPEQWQADDQIFDRVNRQGTVNVLTAAQKHGVKRVIYTSTMDVFEAPSGGTLVETRVDPHPKPTAYERSKQAAEQEANRFLEQGLDIVFLNPSAVYGPAPIHVSLNALLIKALKRELPLTPPGGMPVVYIDGVVQAHLAAAEIGRSGERYLLSDTYQTCEQLVATTLQLAGIQKVPPTAPFWLIRLLAAVSAPFARRFGFEPLVAPGQASFLAWQIRVDATKAQAELGFMPTPVEDGLQKTLDFLRSSGAVPRS